MFDTVIWYIVYMDALYKLSLDELLRVCCDKMFIFMSPGPAAAAQVQRKPAASQTFI